MGKTVRSKKVLTYHGRRCRPMVHKTDESKRKFIMVRKSSGGRKRLYLTKQGKIPVGQQK